VAHDPGITKAGCRKFCFVDLYKFTNSTSLVERNFSVTSKEQGSVVICAIVKDEAPYILEWLAYHMALGVDHFYIYDNESGDGTSLILRRLAARGLITYVWWPDAVSTRIDPSVGSQFTAYRDFQKYKQNAKWVAFLDVDEFFLPLIDHNVQDFLGRFQNADAVGINWRIYGSFEAVGHKSVLSRFTRRADESFESNLHIKSFVKTDALIEGGVHFSKILEGGRYVDASGHLIKNPSHLQLCNGVPTAVINHYFVKSCEEWGRKRLRGRADLSAEHTEKFRPNEHFVLHDRNEVEDESILRFLAPTQAIEKLLNSMTEQRSLLDRLAAWSSNQS
jgi:Glycosyltransferase family 92